MTLKPGMHIYLAAGTQETEDPLQFQNVLQSAGAKTQRRHEAFFRYVLEKECDPIFPLYVQALPAAKR
jgi:hypothetical protein